MLMCFCSVTSNKVEDGVRTVTMTRDLAGKTSDHYTFDPSVASIPIISAMQVVWVLCMLIMVPSSGQVVHSSYQHWIVPHVSVMEESKVQSMEFLLAKIVLMNPKVKTFLHYQV